MKAKNCNCLLFRLQVQEFYYLANPDRHERIPCMYVLVRISKISKVHLDHVPTFLASSRVIRSNLPCTFIIRTCNANDWKKTPFIGVLVLSTEVYYPQLALSVNWRISALRTNVLYVHLARGGSGHPLHQEIPERLVENWKALQPR